MFTQFLTKCLLVNITLRYSRQDLHSLVQHIRDVHFTVYRASVKEIAPVFI